MGDLLLLVLGDKNLSSWSLRPWLALRHAGIPFEERVLSFAEEDWRDKVAALSPSRTVPALRHGELVVSDSLAICEYVAELAPGAKLWPDERAARAVARAVSAEMHGGFGRLRRERPMNVTARVPRRAPSAELEQEIGRVQGLWQDCRARFGAGGPFLFGRFSIADAMFAPVVFRFRTYDIPVAEGARPYYDAMLELPAMKEWEAAAAAEVRALSDRAAALPPSPTSAADCYAVIFTSQLAKPAEGYARVADEMVALAATTPGYLGIDSVRGTDGAGITISYWESLEAITRFRADARHREAQRQGRERFYERYEIRVCSVERGYKFP